MLVSVGSYFVVTGVLQAFVPLRAATIGASGVTLGALLVLVGGGLGVFTDFGFVAIADARGRAQVVSAGYLFGLAAVVIILVDTSLWVLSLACLLAGFANSAVLDSVLALLSTTPHSHTQERTQGFNVTIQRFGALISALTIGIALATRRESVLLLVAGIACMASIAALHSRGRARPASLLRAEQNVALGLRQLLVAGYREGLGLLRRRKILMASLVSVAVNLIFIETNSFLPLVDPHHGVRQAVFVTASLAARDLVAMAVGVWTLATGRDASSPPAVTAVLVAAAVGAAGVGLEGYGSHVGVIPCCALQGVAIGVGVAAMNLLAVGGSSQSHRSLAMAAATLVNRMGVIVLPLALGTSLELVGLRSVFVLVAIAEVTFAFAFYLVARLERS